MSNVYILNMEKINAKSSTYLKIIKMICGNIIITVNSLHSSMVVCIHPIVLYCLHPRGKTVVFFSNKVNEKTHMPIIHITVLL